SFVKAADGIRDRNVTGVQTCALPISNRGNNTDKVRRHRKDLIDQKLRDGKYYIHCLVFLYIFTTFSFYNAYSSRSAASISLNEVKSLINHTGTPTSPSVAAISPEVRIKSASLARPFDEMVSVASTLMSLAQPQSFRTSSREFFKYNDVPRPLTQ